ncbi:MAG: hypothetical protein ACFUZC_04960 [Chthoniobacteraceae bacterium]
MLAPELDIELTPQMKDELVKGEHAAEAFALASQRRIAEANAQIDHAFVDGLGELKMQIHPDIYWRMVALYGPRCWHDPEFRASVYKKNPEVRVHCRSRKTTVRVQGLRRSSQVPPQTPSGLYIAHR